MWILALLTILFIQFYFKIRESNRKKNLLKMVPGPPAKFIFGNTLDFVDPKTRQVMVKKYIETYGGICKIYDGPFSVALLVTDHKFIEFILNAPTKLIDKAYQYQYFESWLGNGLFTSRGIKWRTMRKILTPSFHFSILNQFVDVFESVVDVLIAELGKQVDKESVDIYPFITLCMLDMVCEAAMGTSVNAQENKYSDYVKSVKTMLRVITDRISFPLPSILYRLTPNYYKERKALKILHSYTDSVINKKIEELKTKSVSDNIDKEYGIKKRMAFLDTLLQYRVDGKPLSRRELREEVDTFMFAGHDTVGSSISFILFCLATHPEIQEKVIKEQIDIFGEDWRKSKILPNHLQDMKYLELVVKETLRLYPSAIGIGKTFLKDVEYDGVTYPKGLNVLILTLGCHRNPKYFTNPEKFIPERFEEKDYHVFSYLPFGAGSRNCIGQKFAMMIMKTTVSKVIRNFVLLPSNPQHNLQLVPAIILLSKNGVKISLRKRT